jgi:hypothetical protein
MDAGHNTECRPVALQVDQWTLDTVLNIGQSLYRRTNGRWTQYRMYASSSTEGPMDAVSIVLIWMGRKLWSESSSVFILTAYRMDDWCSIIDKGKIFLFSTASRLVLTAT